MPVRNAIKTYTENSYYHVYNRGVDKQLIFRDEDDKIFFLSVLKKYLSLDQILTRRGHLPYESYATKIDLLCYCLMDNHFHLLFYQHDDGRSLPDLMRRIMTSYSMYFNKKYERVGPLFQGRYLASRIDNDAYLYHISRYIHRNPELWRDYKFSSLKYYTGKAHVDWVKPHAILDLFNDSPKKYIDFVTDMDEDDEETVADFMAHE